MAAAKDGKSRVANWDNDMDRALLNILVEIKHTSDGFVSGTFTKTAWRSAVQKFNEVCRMTYTVSNLKNRFKNIKKVYCLYVSLKNKSGWGWDEEKNMPIPGCEEEWEALIAVCFSLFLIITHVLQQCAF